MKIATGLTLIAIGAILTFAVTTSPSFLNLQITGVVLMLVGVAGLFIPRRGYGWLRRQMVVRKTTRGPVVTGVQETRYPPYIMLNPGATPDDSLQPGIPEEVVEEPVSNPPTVPDLAAEERRAERRSSAERPPPAGTEIVDEYLEE
jgi:hypothetical protein